MPGNMNTTRCEKVGRDENEKAYCVAERMIGLVSTGLEGRIRPNGGAADMDLARKRSKLKSPNQDVFCNFRRVDIESRTAGKMTRKFHTPIYDWRI